MVQEILTAILGYALVGVLWGCSNPFIKRAQSESQSEKADTKSPSIVASITRLMTNPRMFFPFLINQSGSFVYYYMLSSEPVSRASPICNALTFLFTAVTGYLWFGEEVRNPVLLCLGVLAVLIGVFISMI
jgi:drug/metabolite transporter (DMT)-like permease